MKLLVDPLRNKWAVWNFSILAFLNGRFEDMRRTAKKLSLHLRMNAASAMVSY